MKIINQLLVENCKQGNMEVVYQLLAEHADINTKEGAPLLWAVHGGI